MSQVWFITGAGRGIGAHIARAALQAGHRVVATGRKLAPLREAYADVAPESIALVELDVASEAQAEQAVQTAVERFGRIDVLVNNAGYGQLGYFEEISADAIERQFATNVFGLMHVLRATLPVMRRQRAGHVFNLSSIGGALGFEGSSVYCASKFAVEGLSASVALEVARFGIKVTVVEPGFFRTDFLDNSSIRYGDRAPDGYGDAGPSRDIYEGYNHRQAGDPAKLGAALVQLAGMAAPPKQFLAGSDALAIVGEALQGRLDEMRTFADLSRSTDGVF
ncbi:SDR family NAD(P)-dependent oxidoreductase [Massilia norwichensis]|jgi:NAD(P)-dependent dehydrogenase (short-subunit alcohol dehydrogenase family)|uniref:SDR family NAD(P)-dependent oxidoreductase n=1 Tax=Massilia norwichensis TaxID=1442366 RepID=A0ABT2A4B1_9BURK|nr:SDR family NAD(P)-dependent oxidoreductase [Massilia norwichensis]MCS0589019.1 SDR family NAD(P)-dependent oxidoreductase [Massilia norwichensis]